MRRRTPGSTSQSTWPSQATCARVSNRSASSISTTLPAGTTIGRSDSVCGETGRTVDVRTWVNGVYVNTHGGDGFIVATPTGSTAYALSCGGPIVHPSLDAIVLVPVSPHTLSDRPIVVPAGSVVEIELADRFDTRAQVACDGHVLCDLEPGVRLRIERAKVTATLLHPPGHDYYRILRSKLHWGRGTREGQPPGA